jgi:hypothetical protein
MEKNAIHCISMAALCCLPLLGACSYIKASEREKTSAFLTHGSEMKHMPERYPFQRVWVADRLAGKERRHYSKIYIAPVDVSFFDTDTWKVRARDVDAHPEDIKEIGDYMRARFVKEVKSWPGSVVEVVGEDDRSPETVRLELAIIELVPTASGRKIISSAAGFLIPGGGLIGARSAGSIAIEGRVRDAASGEVIGEFADREADKRAPIDLAGFKWYSRSKENIDDWAKQFAELANTTPDQKVKESLPFTLNPF